MADHGEELFPSDFFCDLYPSKWGRPTTPARTIATVMILGAFEGLADEKATAKLKYDMRWKVAAGVAIDAPVFIYSVICLLRSRLLNSSSPERIFDALYNHYRSFAERMNAQLVKVLHAGEKSRYIGLEKSKFCISQREASVNLSRISKLLVA